MKRLISIVTVLAILMAGMLAGCGEKSSGGSGVVKVSRYR